MVHNLVVVVLWLVMVIFWQMTTDTNLSNSSEMYATLVLIQAMLNVHLQAIKIVPLGVSRLLWTRLPAQGIARHGL